MKLNFIGRILFLVGVLMVSIGMIVINQEDSLKLGKNYNTYKTGKISDVSNIQMRISDDSPLRDINMSAAPGALIRVEVFDGLTIEELSDRLNRAIGGAMSGKGLLIATESLKRGVDPYVATAIMMHETGNGTSGMCRTCYNFGGQKGSGCGSYQRFSSTDEGITKMIDNLYRNYYARGLTTIEAIAPRYAESSTWPSKIHMFVNRIKSS